jgi:hypothetical protein
MKSIKILVVTIALMAMACGPAMATPSGTVWTPMTLDIQSFKVLHIGIDNYFTVAKKAISGEQGAFATDLGLTTGILPFEKIQMEAGVDGFYPTDYPYVFNAKIGAPEDALFKYSPALQVGIYGVGTKKDLTDQNIIFGVIGKSIPEIGRISAGPYLGNKKLLLDKNGEKENSGFMVAFDRGFFPVKDSANNEYNKVVIAADYASGKNIVGGTGVGANYYFTKDVSLLIGGVFFNEKAINGEWKLTTQLDINLPF